MKAGTRVLVVVYSALFHCIERSVVLLSVVSKVPKSIIFTRYSTNYEKLDSMNFDSLNITRMELMLDNRQLQFVTLLNEVWGKSATPDKASNGFRAFDIYPLNRNAMPENALWHRLSRVCQWRLCN